MPHTVKPLLADRTFWVGETIFSGKETVLTVLFLQILQISTKRRYGQFYGDRYSQKSFFEIKVCLSHFRKLKSVEDWHNSAMRCSVMQESHNNHF